jgi:hypothetical protein
MFSMMLSHLVVTYALPARKAWHMISKSCRMPSMCIITVDYIFVLGKGMPCNGHQAAVSCCKTTTRVGLTAATPHQAAPERKTAGVCLTIPDAVRHLVMTAMSAAQDTKSFSPQCRINIVVADWTSKPLRTFEVRLKTKCLKIQCANKQCSRSREPCIYLAYLLYCTSRSTIMESQIPPILQLAKGVRRTCT